MRSDVDEGLPALSIAWGTWAGAGMAHRLGSEFAQMQEASGLGMLSLDEGFTALTALSTSSISSSGGPPDELGALRRLSIRTAPLAATMCTPTETSSSLRATLESLDEDDRIRHLDAFMKTLVPRFELDAAVTSLGVTSLGATALAASLSEALSSQITSHISLRVRVAARHPGPRPITTFSCGGDTKGVTTQNKLRRVTRYGSHLYH